MVKTKNKEVNLALFANFKALYNFDIYKKTYTNISLFYNYLILIFGILLINIYNYFNSFGVEISDVIVGTFLLTPFVILLFYFFFYIFISSLVTKTKEFLNGYLVFSNIFLLIIQVGIIISFILQKVGLDFWILFLMVIIGFSIIMIINLKNYYDTIWQKVLFSLILLDLTFALIGIFITAITASALGNTLY